MRVGSAEVLLLRRHWWAKFLLLGGVGSTLAVLAFGGLLFLSVLGFLGVSTGTGTTPGFGTAYSATAVVPKSGGMSQAHEEFAGALVACTGLAPYVALAWVASEGGGVNPGQPGWNFLFLTAVGGGFREFGSPQEAAQAVCQTLQARDYAGIL